ncbi:hypothetical protein SSU98_1113 [Streptococcus suis 98HAH33]|nr:hypothetical protein SSU98_1113 [Streptococcus suis 98HAH33]
MKAKKFDKLESGILYSIDGVIVVILTSLILYILLSGLAHVSSGFFDK